ncbi:hypothetical protein PFISCL1PPCAC_19616 [Pristionchus fissidentatus]|uniref:Uncharacterized protein n=1 Tax=Pristionchus fissidentatus TaxID=1538716 RepID=A0AAV5WC64_9BILA|nr:hypothetical protein PFISCL1PPCAC_19616 [Pristionchus fissidentatus]
MDGLCTRSGVLAPDVEDEDGSDEDERHHEHGDGSDLETSRVLGVELPETTIVDSGARTNGSGGGGTSSTPLAELGTSGSSGSTSGATGSCGGGVRHAGLSSKNERNELLQKRT